MISRMKFAGAALRALALALTLASAFAVPSHAQEKKEIVLGVTIPVLPNYTDWWRDGANLAVADVNAAGGIDGAKARVQIEAFNDPAGAVSALKKLMEADQVKAIVGAHSSGFLAEASVAKDKDVVLMNAGASAPAIRQYGGTNIFSVIPLGTAQYEAIAKAAYLMGYRKIVAEIERSDMGTSGLEVFKKVFEGMGGAVVGTVEHNQTAGDFRSQLLKLKSIDHDAIFLITAVADTAQLLKQAAQLGVKGPWLAYEVGVGQPVLDVAGKAADGLIWAAFTYDPDDGPAATVAWAQRFKRQYGYLPNIYPAAIYDGVRVLLEAVKQAGSVDPAKVIPYLKKIEYEGVTGPIKFDKDNMLEQPVRLMTIQNGKFVKCTACPKV